MQLTANAGRMDGSLEDITQQASWTTNPGQVALQVNSTGVATGKQRGEATVTVSYGGRSATRPLFVLPAGTFRLSGTVTENGGPIANAAVTVISGIGEGLNTLTDSTGGYRLYGVSGRVRLHTKKDGYQNSIENVDVPEHPTFDFAMVGGPRPNLAGVYTLRIDAGPCAPYSFGSLPDEASSRTYTASVKQDGGRLTVVLSGANFLIDEGRGNQFTGLVDPAGAMTFTVRSTDLLAWPKG